MRMTKTRQAHFDFVSDLASDYDKCVFCHDDIPSLLTRAHHYHKKERLATPDRPDINDTDWLCWSCHHGLLHAGLITVDEVRQAAKDTVAGTRKVTHDQVYRQIADDIAAGHRHVNWQALHNLTAEELSARAVKAHKTRSSSSPR